MHIEMLAIGRNEEILQTVLRLVNNNGQWHAVGAQTDDDAIALFDKINPAIVLLCNGIDEASDIKLQNYFIGKNPATIIIQHYGGGSGLLSNEILQALHAGAIAAGKH